jgi:uncharacterized protein YndB with AHSA1/START domain
MNTAPDLDSTIEIAAPISQVWRLVSDVRNMADWSPQVTSTRLRTGFDSCALGAQFTNRNAHGELEWITHAEIVRFSPESEIAFRIEENWAIWGFELAPIPGGTRVTQRRETPDGISDLSQQLTDGFMGGTDKFTDALRAGMRTTLEGIKGAAES